MICTAGSHSDSQLQQFFEEKSNKLLFWLWEKNQIELQSFVSKSKQNRTMAQINAVGFSMN